MVKEQADATRKYGLGPLWQVLLNVALIFIGSQIIAAIIVEFGLNVLHFGHAAFDNSAAAQFAYVVMAEGLAGGLVYLVIRAKKLSLATIGLGRLPKRGDLLYALGGFMVFYIVLITVSVILSFFFPDIGKGNQDVGFNHLNNLADTLLAFFGLVFLPPLGEEPLVRGYLYSGLRQKFTFMPAMLITSVLFGAAHLQTGAGPGLLWAAGINTFVLSVILVYLRERSGALYAGMIVHGLNNAIAFGFHFHALMF